MPTRFILTVEVTSDRDPSDLLDEVIALELDDVEVDEDTACVEEVDPTWTLDPRLVNRADLLHDRAPHLLGFMCHLLLDCKVDAAVLPYILSKPWKWQTEYTQYVASLKGSTPSEKVA
jgi:hypothetical protein